MRIIAVTGIKGGVGTTTVAAHVSAALRAQGEQVMALDLCPQNSLRLFFGMPCEIHDGIAPALLDGKVWFEACYKNQTGLYFVPFGDLHNEIPKELMPLLFPESFHQLSDQLKNINFEGDGWLIVDCPVSDLESEWYNHLVEASDAVIRVITSDALSYALLRQGDRYDRSDKEMLLVNRFTPAVDLEQDLKTLLLSEYRDHLLPVVVHEDKNICQALAHKQTVFEYAPYSQAYRDFECIATWLIAKRAVSSGRAHQRPENEGIKE